MMSANNSRMSLDLNLIPDESMQIDDPPLNLSSAQYRGLVSAANPGVTQQQTALPSQPPNCNVVIDVDALDDELEITSARGHSQGRNRARQTSRRSNPELILVEDLETSHRSLGNASSSYPAFNQIYASSVFDIHGYSIHSTLDLNNKGMQFLDHGPQFLKPKKPTFSCPICLNPLDRSCSTICGHIFCENCISTAIKMTKMCPTCRRKLNSSNFHRVYLPTPD